MIRNNTRDWCVDDGHGATLFFDVHSRSKEDSKQSVSPIRAAGFR